MNSLGSIYMRFSFWLNILIFVSFAFAQNNNSDFAQRREALMEKINDGIIVLAGAKEVERNNDVNYKFRQSSNFYYLTGFDEPNAFAILIPGGENPFTLFVKERNQRMAIWLGESHGISGAMSMFSADTAFKNDEFEEILKSILRNKSKVYLPISDSDIMEKVRQLIDSPWGNYPDQIEDLNQHINEMRMIKSDYEVSMLQKAINITANAHNEAMKVVKHDIYEYEIEAVIEYIYKKNGSPRIGFPSIVGSGPNSTVLHYDKNNRKMQDGDMLVMDIGAEYGMYSADVTRTIPVNGKFSDDQKDIYEIVLAAQKAGIELTKPGVGYLEISNRCIEVIKDGLLKVGLITDKSSNWQTRIWFMHGIGHGLGLDVHDSGSYYGTDRERGRILQPGMVFTIEPGIYISASALENLTLLLAGRVDNEEMEEFIQKVKPAFEKYKNIGVRIEDDILVTKDGSRNLSANVPREINEIEKLMAKESEILKK